MVLSVKYVSAIVVLLIPFHYSPFSFLSFTTATAKQAEQPAPQTSTRTMQE